MAGKVNKGNKRLKDYGKVLMAKQLLRAIYNNPRERVFKSFFGKKMETKVNYSESYGCLISEPKTPAPTINKVFTGLSSRLEIVLTAMGGALSFQHARQLINHGKVSVNGYTVKQRSYLLKDGDIVVSKAGLKFTENLSFSARLAQKGGPSLRGGRFASNEDREKRQAQFQLEKKLGGMKTVKVPGFLKIKTPVAASLLVNPELNLGIYYSKALFSQKELANSNAPRGEESNYTKSKIEGWKNLSVKELKLLLAPVNSEASTNVLGKSLASVANEVDEGGQSKGASKNHRLSLSLAKQEQVKWENLYSLVQAYYLRK